MDQWTLIIIVAVIGALFYFIIGDWFNGYIKSANPLKTHPGTKPK